MQIEVKELEPCKLLVSCEIDAQGIEQKKDEVLNIFKNASVPGFRKGKASVQAIKHYYRNQINESLKRALAEDALHQSLLEKEIKPFGGPSFTEMYLQPGSFSCQFVIHKKPDFELQQFQDWEIPKPHQPLTAEQQSQLIFQNLRMTHGTQVPFSESQFLQQDDIAIVTYEVSVDGEKQDALCAYGDTIVIGKSNLPGFDTNLLNATVGETRSFDVPIDAKVNNPYAGKTLSFAVTVNAASRIEPCPLTDELAVKMGKSTLQELEQEVRASAFSYVENLNRSALLNAVIARLVSGHEISVPDWLSLREAQYLAASSNAPWDSISNESKERFLTQAQKNVKLSLILEKIRESNPDAQLSEQEAISLIRDNLSRMTTKPVDELMKEMNSAGHLQMFYNRIVDEYTLDFASKNVKIID